MSRWRIHSWSREHARGTIASSASAQPLEFDAAVALVDDFAEGEEVEVEFEHGQDGLKVAKVWPRRSRPNIAATVQGALPEHLSKNTRVFSERLADLGPGCTLEVTTASTNVIELAVVQSAGEQRSIGLTARFKQPNYAQLEWRMMTGSYRLSAYRWRSWLEHNEDTVQRWSLDPSTVASTAYVFALEPLSFGEQRIQYIVAQDLTLAGAANTP